MKGHFTCDMCKEHFARAWTEEEAEEEAKKLWGDQVLDEELATLCDECFEHFMASLRN